MNAYLIYLQVISMLLSLLAIFIIAWGPYLIQAFYMPAFEKSVDFLHGAKNLREAFTLLSFASATIDAVLIPIFSKWVCWHPTNNDCPSVCQAVSHCICKDFPLELIRYQTLRNDNDLNFDRCGKIVNVPTQVMGCIDNNIRYIACATCATCDNDNRIT